jgi:hypothetical protein
MKKQHYINIGFGIAFLLILLGFKGENPSPQEPQFDWKQVTTIESVVKGGVGRSRMIATDDSGKMTEEKMQNFFSVTGINFDNVRQNDLQITDMVAKMSTEGWVLHDVTSGVYGTENSTGIFITRYLFKKAR